MRILLRAALYVLLATPCAAAIAAGCSETETSGTGTGTQSTSSATTSSSGGTGGVAGSGTTTSAGGAGTSAGGAGTSAGGAGTSAGGAGGAGGASTTSTGAGGGPIVPVKCTNQIYQCGDGIDNDNDGLIDWQDPDCLGPCDNTEDSFHPDIPGGDGPACIVDCYFDSNSGPGNDECYWNHACDPHEQAPDYYPESNNGAACEYDPNANTPGTPLSCDELYMTQSQQCYDFCGPLTPNGCDCFGCCELPGNPGNYVWLGSEDSSGNGKCSVTNLSDPNYCEPCLPVQACLNTCELCELCVGKPTLPPECYPDAGTPDGGSTTDQCPPGVQPCGLPGQPLCPNGYYCITGCCVLAPP